MKYLSKILLFLCLFTVSVFSQIKSDKSEISIPLDLSQSFSILDSLLSADDINMIKNESEEGTVNFHMSLGLWIRNNWKLWNQNTPLSKYFNDLGIFYPDDMSGIIITSYWRHLNDKPINLQSQIEYYTEYWKSQNKPLPNSTSELLDSNNTNESNDPAIKDSIQISTANKYQFVLHKSKLDFYRLLTTFDVDTAKVWFYYFPATRDKSSNLDHTPKEFVKSILSESEYNETGRLWVFDISETKQEILDYCDAIDLSTPIDKILSDNVKLEIYIRPATGDVYCYRGILL